MKKFVSLFTVLCLLTALLPVAASMYDPDARTMYVKTPDGKSVNLREQPDSNATILDRIPYGAGVTVYSDFISKVWSHVQYGMLNGFVKTQYLTDAPPKPYPTPKPTPKPTSKPTAKPTKKPTAKPTAKPTPTLPPSPEDLIAREISMARSLGLVPPDMSSEGNCTWQELDALLTNAIRLKSKNPAMIRNHVYLTLEEYQAADVGAPFNIVLRGVAAAEMYGALIDMGDSDPAINHSNDPYIADTADIDLCQEYTGLVITDSADWRALSMLEMIIIVIDHADNNSGKAVLTLDADHQFLPTQALARMEAILGVYRLYHSYRANLGIVTVTHHRQANLRAKPSMKATIVGKVNPGAVYEVISIPKDGWFQIQLPNGDTAYIAAGMVSFAMH